MGCKQALRSSITINASKEGPHLPLYIHQVNFATFSEARSSIRWTMKMESIALQMLCQLSKLKHADMRLHTSEFVIKTVTFKVTGKCYFRAFLNYVWLSAAYRSLKWRILLSRNFFQKYLILLKLFWQACHWCKIKFKN